MVIKKCINKSIEISRRRGVWNRCRHFTFILDGKKIVSLGTNSKKTHPLNLLYPYTNRNMETISQFVGTHSEMKAVLLLGPENCRGLSLFNIRIDRNGMLRQSRPCRGCMSMIKNLGFYEIFHTDNEGRVVRLAPEAFFGVPKIYPKHHFSPINMTK
jgi:hypothetical protein